MSSFEISKVKNLVYDIMLVKMKQVQDPENVEIYLELFKKIKSAVNNALSSNFKNSSSSAYLVKDSFEDLAGIMEKGIPFQLWKMSRRENLTQSSQYSDLKVTIGDTINSLDLQFGKFYFERYRDGPIMKFWLSCVNFAYHNLRTMLLIIKDALLTTEEYTQEINNDRYLIYEDLFIAHIEDYENEFDTDDDSDESSEEEDFLCVCRAGGYIEKLTFSFNEEIHEEKPARLKDIMINEDIPYEYKDAMKLENMAWNFEFPVDTRSKSSCPMQYLIWSKDKDVKYKEWKVYTETFIEKYKDGIYNYKGKTEYVILFIYFSISHPVLKSTHSKKINKELLQYMKSYALIFESLEFDEIVYFENGPKNLYRIAFMNTILDILQEVNEIEKFDRRRGKSFIPLQNILKRFDIITKMDPETGASLFRERTSGTDFGLIFKYPIRPNDQDQVLDEHFLWEKKFLKFNALEDMIKDHNEGECNICFEKLDLSGEKVVISAACKHLLCLSCFKIWITRCQMEYRCTVCQQASYSVIYGSNFEKIKELIFNYEIHTENTPEKTTRNAKRNFFY